jgi:hypothetical protein
VPIAFRSIAGNSLAGTTLEDTTLVISKPAGTVSGDVMVAVIGQTSTSGSALISPPAGWVSLGAQAATNGKGEAFYRVAASEGASYSFTVAGGDPHAAAGLIASYSGADAAAPIDAVGSQHSASSISEPAPSVVPGATGAMLICCYGAEGAANSDTVTSTPPSGMTERGDVARFGAPSGDYNVALDIHVSLNDLLLASTSPTGVKTATLSAARENSGFSVLLRSAEAPPPPPPASVAGLHMVI